MPAIAIDFKEVQTVEQPIKDVVMGFIKELVAGPEQNIPALIGCACIWHYHILYDFPPLPVLLPNPTVFNPYRSHPRYLFHQSDPVPTHLAHSIPIPRRSHGAKHPRPGLELSRVQSERLDVDIPIDVDLQLQLPGLGFMHDAFVTSASDDSDDDDDACMSGFVVLDDTLYDAA